MMVRLTVRQHGRVAELVGEATVGRQFEQFDMWWGRAWPSSKHRIDTAMPAIGWRIVEEIMFNHCFDERGFRAKERVRTTDLNALKQIRRTLNARESHPALQQRGAIGLIAEMIPAWRFPAPDASGKLYSPYPVLAMPFVVLAPESRTVQLKQTTLWVEATRPRELPMLDECSHWAFIQ